MHNYWLNNVHIITKIGGKKTWHRRTFSMERLMDDTGKTVDWTGRHTISIWWAREGKKFNSPSIWHRIPLHNSSGHFYWLIETFECSIFGIGSNMAFECVHLLPMYERKGPWNSIYRQNNIEFDDPKEVLLHFSAMISIFWSLIVKSNHKHKFWRYQYRYLAIMHTHTCARHVNTFQTRKSEKWLFTIVFLVL